MELGLIATNDLITELENRFDTIIIAYEFDNRGKSNCRFTYKGGYSASLGLADRFRHRLLWQDVDESDSDTSE